LYEVARELLSFECLAVGDSLAWAADRCELQVWRDFDR
jgi:hypothetical protein